MSHITICHPRLVAASQEQEVGTPRVVIIKVVKRELNEMPDAVDRTCSQVFMQCGSRRGSVDAGAELRSSVGSRKRKPIVQSHQ